MSSKPNPNAASLPSAADLTLPWACTRVQGPEAQAFLQRQTINDVNRLSDRQGQRSGLLNAKGRVCQLFVLFRFDAEQFVLATPQAEQALLNSSLQRFVLRSKLRLSVADDCRVRGHWQAPNAGCAAPAMRWDGDRWLTLDCSASDPTTEAEQGEALQRWRHRDLEQGIVELNASSRELFTPQMLGLQRWQAFSLSKGCYPGQEIVARTHYLGQQKRGLFLLHDPTAALPPGTTLQAQAREAGVVVNSDDSGYALAVLPSDVEEVQRGDTDSALRILTRFETTPSLS